MKDALAYGVVQGVAHPPLSWVVLSPLALYFRIYRRVFPNVTRRGQSARKLVRGRSRDRIERNDPELFERVTGRKARPSDRSRE